MGKLIKTSKSPLHPLQTSAWASFRKAMGIDVGIIDDWHITFHQIPYTPWTVGYFPKGPLPTKTLLEKLHKLGREKHAVYIQIEPTVEKIHGWPLTGNSQLVRSHHPLFTKYTYVVDLTKSEEELLKAMHPKTRYNIRIAEKHHVTIQEESSPDAFEKYLKLAKETTDRQGFYAHNETYHRTMWSILHKEGIAHLFTASYEGTMLSAWIIFVHDGVMYYPYGASSRDHREVMAPTLLLWRLIQWGKSHKLTAFDLWGALGPNPDPKDPWFGFHRFKTGFSPKLVEFVGSYDLIIQPFLYRLYCLADTIRWKLLSMVR